MKPERRRGRERNARTKWQTIYNLSSIIYYLERDEGVGGPIGVEGYVACDWGGGAGEEVAAEPGDLVLAHGDVEVAVEELVVISVEGCDGEVEGAFFVVQEGVEVELPLGGSDFEPDILLALDHSQAGGGIESAGSTGIIETQLLDFGGYIVVRQFETAEGGDAVEGDLHISRLIAYGNLCAIHERVGESLGVGEPDAGGVLHRGVAIAAVAHNNKPVVVLLQLEGALAEGGHIGCLVDLLDALSV